jgi:hypothetical protein
MWWGRRDQGRKTGVKSLDILSVLLTTSSSVNGTRPQRIEDLHRSLGRDVVDIAGMMNGLWIKKKT